MRPSLLARSVMCWALCACACSRKPIEQSRAVAQPDLPEPSTVVAEVAVRQPGATYLAIRELGAPVAALLPVGFAVFASNLLGLPPLTAAAFDPEITAVGVLAQRAEPATGLGVVLALHVLSGPEFVAQLTTGAHAPFRAERMPTAGLTALRSNQQPSGAPERTVLGILDNYLLVASDDALLDSVGPYVVRMLPRHPPSQHLISLRISPHALSTLGVPALRRLWANYRTALASEDRDARTAHGGRPPDFGDPAQVILGSDALVESGLTILQSVSEIEVGLDPEPSRVLASVSLTPAPGSPAQAALASLGVGNAKSLLSLPASTRVALGLTRLPSDREESAKSAGEAWVQLLGARLAEQDAKKLRGVLADWELGQGEHTSYGFLGGPEPGIFVTTDVTDAASLERAGHGLIGLLALPAVRAPLAEFGGEPRVTESEVAQPDYARKVHLAKITFSARGPRSAPVTPLPALSCAWVVDDKVATFVAGKDAESLLRAVTQAAQATAATLGADSEVASGVARLGEQSAAFLFFDARILAPDAKATAPVLLAFGRSGQRALLRLDIPQRAVGIALHQITGF